MREMIENALENLPATASGYRDGARWMANLVLELERSRPAEMLSATRYAELMEKVEEIARFNETLRRELIKCHGKIDLRDDAGSKTVDALNKRMDDVEGAYRLAARRPYDHALHMQIDDLIARITTLEDAEQSKVARVVDIAQHMNDLELTLPETLHDLTTRIGNRMNDLEMRLAEVEESRLK